MLAGELTAVGGDHITAFGSYQRSLGDHVGGNQKPMPGGVKAFLPKTGLGIRLGNGLTRVMLAGPWRGMLTAGMQDKTNSVTLRNYANDAMLVDGER
ncbi:MAG TPA: hypothetical protein VJT49_00640 [Amycolatopsis sp.]|uniref:hypothetical protein n=1 Tax=Amycolatopsis sp. TaxID=37632 RepID=UPI002B47FD31|nr:hypothetical protein [Amycolatopsis sp.]HKS43622.1 hypothetical protein [Amycolatopsis sp.]